MGRRVFQSTDEEANDPRFRLKFSSHEVGNIYDLGRGGMGIGIELAKAGMVGALAYGVSTSCSPPSTRHCWARAWYLFRSIASVTFWHVVVYAPCHHGVVDLPPYPLATFIPFAVRGHPV